MTSNEIKSQVQCFFHDFAVQIILMAKADPNNPQAVKMALLEHYEEIYPRFSTTEVFKQCNHTPLHDTMVEAYKHNFGLLLSGILP